MFDLPYRDPRIPLQISCWYSAKMVRQRRVSSVLVATESLSPDEVRPLSYTSEPHYPVDRRGVGIERVPEVVPFLSFSRLPVLPVVEMRTGLRHEQWDVQSLHLRVSTDHDWR